MIEQRWSEWAALEQSARAYLAAPHTIPAAAPLDRWRWCLRLWHHPSFTPSRSWTVYQPHDPRQPRTLLRQVTWDRPTDAHRFSDPLAGLQEGFHPQPTVGVRDRPIDPATFANRLAALRSMSIPVFATTGAITLDGETFGVALADPGASVTWRSQAPASWAQLIDWASESRTWLDGIACTSA